MGLIQHDWAPDKKRRVGHRRIERKNDHGKKTANYKPKRDAQGGLNPANTFISDFQPRELRDNKCLLFKPLSLWYFVVAAPAG